jgi:hypothetical protein
MFMGAASDSTGNDAANLEHVPQKWHALLRQDHVQGIGLARILIVRPMSAERKAR